MYDAPSKRVNHRVAENYICAKVRAGHDLLPEDVLYLVDRLEAVRRQLDDERDAAEAELVLRQEARRAAEDERYERDMRFAP